MGKIKRSKRSHIDKTKDWYRENIGWRFGKRPTCKLTNLIGFVAEGEPIVLTNCQPIFEGTWLSADPKHYKKAKKIATIKDKLKEEK